MEHVNQAGGTGNCAKEFNLRCHMEGCGVTIKGGVDELKHHYKQVHLLNTSSKNVLPFICSICNTTYLRFYHLKSHILQCHSEYQQVPQCSTMANDPIEMDVDDTVDDNASDLHTISNPFFFEPPVTIQQLSLEMSNQITRMRCDVSLPESKIQSFIEGCSTSLKWSQKYAITIIKQFIEAKDLLYEDPKVIKLFNDLEIPNVYNDIKTHEDNLSYLAMQANCTVPTPQEIVIAKRRKVKHVVLGAKRCSKFQPRIQGIQKYSQKVTHEKDVCHYISLKDTLRLIMSNSEARRMVQAEEPRNDGMICSYKDGLQFQQHPFLQRFPRPSPFNTHR
ncbi:uncharacterized protein LOC131678010 [Topomyia yanbarensis]|uniref:uncharacterized protein LOC131678010 n=1 Tax=Topomyia yanbarensis TaxID=2498891 RepID=UPI00273B7F19|nr:uncharacterized protein LOC131678010 [Topomyia yanbarensis]XP_058814117.1 uncharacterized protein LOC131678010 [Topomyia yanbarensis]